MNPQNHMRPAQRFSQRKGNTGSEQGSGRPCTVPLIAEERVWLQMISPTRELKERSPTYPLNKYRPPNMARKKVRSKMIARAYFVYLQQEEQSDSGVLINLKLFLHNSHATMASG